jgi:hypothetical protein
MTSKGGGMRTVGRRVVLVSALAVAGMGSVIAAGGEDDLAVVKRAVARQEAPASTPPAAAAEEPITRVDEKDDWERRSETRPRTGGPGRDLRWFKVRITEKGAKRARVNVNLPIALVRALGDDFPIDIGGHGGWRGGREKAIRLGEILATLEAGQSLVEIDDDHATVRVWVE